MLSVKGKEIVRIMSYTIDKNRLEFILGGKSLFELRSNVTGKTYRYSILKAKIERSNDIRDKYTNTYFIKVFNGFSYDFAGCIKYDKVLEIVKYMKTKEGLYDIKDKPINALLWTIKNIKKEEKMKKVDIIHLNICACCGEELLDDADREIGMHTGVCEKSCQEMVNVNINN